MTVDPTRPGADDVWLVQRLGERLAQLIWPYIELAESERLQRTYGYPKDNALPPPLPTRLCDPHFVASLRRAVDDDDEAPDELTERAISMLVGASVEAD